MGSLEEDGESDNGDMSPITMYLPAFLVDFASQHWSELLKDRFIHKERAIRGTQLLFLGRRHLP